MVFNLTFVIAARYVCAVLKLIVFSIRLVVTAVTFEFSRWNDVRTLENAVEWHW